jgi:heme-degrading monooxygenase HmoA
MEARARAMPGFVDFKTFASDDGERVSLVIFATLADQAAWRDDPDHRAAQTRGREEFYSEYSIRICEQLDVREFTRP